MVKAIITLKLGKTITVDNLLHISKNDGFTDLVTDFTQFLFTAHNESPYSFVFVGETTSITVAEKELVSVEFSKEL